MEIRIAVVSLWAEDVPAGVHFYRDVLGLPLLAHHRGDHPHFDLGGTYLTIRTRPTRPVLEAGAALPRGCLFRTRPGGSREKTAIP